jgi:ADP-ribosyl-[dinitrogen reductase] hydrolase
MMGAIIGDIIGERHEFQSYKINKSNKDKLIDPVSTFTDDTVLTCATAASITQGISYENNFVTFYRMVTKFKTANKIRNGLGFGEMFAQWAMAPSSFREPYGSCGNGSAMRVSPIGWAYNNAYDVMVEAQLNASPTHNHIEGIKGAQATALSVLMARAGASKEDIKSMLEDLFKYSFNFTLDSLHETYKFEPTCQKTVPEALLCFLESNSFEDAMRNVLYIGGDTDTLGAICGAVAEGMYGVPVNLREEALKILDNDGPILRGFVIDFEQKHGNKIEKIDLNFSQKFINLFTKK